jgi:membrane protease YdiL (CAAX protease family)
MFEPVAFLGVSTTYRPQQPTTSMVCVQPDDSPEKLPQHPREVVGQRSVVAVLMALAFLITALLGPKPLWAIVADGRSMVWQVGVGIAMGLAFSIPVWIVVLKINVFENLRTQMLELAGRADLGGLNPLWFGLCAGVGEEVLCRGALQPLLGIWWTSLLFTLAHYGTGGFKSMNPTKFGYAGFVFLASVLIGHVLIEIGLIAAAVLHSVVDVFGLVVLRREDVRQMPRSA